LASPSVIAQRIIDKLGISNPQDLENLELIAWERGALVLDDKLKGAEARLAAVSQRAIITVSSAVKDLRRRRFSIAHELGHWEIDRYASELSVCTTDDLNNWMPQPNKPNREQEANEFASALLLPEQFFAPLCQGKDPSFELISDLADKFNVSLTATAMRYVRFTIEPCAMVFSKDGLVKWFNGSKQFNDLGAFVEVRVKPDPSSLAASFFQGRSISSSQRNVSASVWLAPGHYRKNAKIKEQALAMPNYNSALTLLWIDEDIEDEDDL
jgi:Zn-dependent peptidase ImmA (M78 family)